MSSTSNVIDEFHQAVDVNCAKLIDSYRTILNKATISSSDTFITHNDELLIQSSVENIIFHSQSLLDKIHYLKVEAIVRESMKSKAQSVVEDLDP